VDISTNKAVLAAVSDVESRLGKSGRVLLRPSGTEPVVRVMVEGEDPAIVESLARELAEIVSTELASAD
jgi:phosphoglucosamine mutase